MRKISLFVGIITSAVCVFGYSSTDVSNAELLADQGIITSQSTTTGYRLDDNITRAEVIGMALKIKGITLPDSYYCKNYFSDVKYNANNNWICRAVELAANAGLVSRTNTKFRPQDKITRAEALIILTKAGGIYEQATQSELPYIFDTDIDWQQELLRGVFGMQLLNLEDYKYTTKVNTSSGPISVATIITVTFYPNRPATRAEVFGFARNILGNEKLNNTQMSCKINGVEIYGDCKIDHGDIRYGKYIETQIYGDNLYQGAECAI